MQLQSNEAVNPMLLPDALKIANLVQVQSDESKQQEEKTRDLKEEKKAVSFFPSI